MYKINVSKYDGRNSYDSSNSYRFFFRIEDDDPFRIKKVAELIKQQYLYPDYNVTFYYRSSRDIETDSDFTYWKKEKENGI